MTLYPAALALLPVAMLMGAPAATAQDVSAMEAALSQEHESGAWMGVARVVKGDRVLLDKAYGSANLEWGIANSSDTKFRIASVTKQFTATAIQLLDQQGKLDIDQPVKTYWPDAPARWDAITVRHLLDHTSGIKSITKHEEFGDWKLRNFDRDEMLRRIANMPIENEPGDKFAYSNSGYILLSVIIEKVSKQSLDDYFKYHLFEPLGMADTAFDDMKSVIPKRASGYAPGLTGPVNASYVNMAIPRGAGALMSTSGDLTKWLDGLFAGRILDAAHLSELTRPSVSVAPGISYAMGLLVSKDDAGTLIWHDGGIEGFNSYLAYDPDRKIGVVVLSNLNGGSATKLGEALTAAARK